MPVKIKYPAKPCCYSLTVFDLVSLLSGVPGNTPIEFRSSPLETEEYKVVRVYKKSTNNLLADDSTPSESNSITIVLL